MIKFRQKQFGVLSSTIKGANIGFLGGNIAAALTGKRIPFFKSKNLQQFQRDAIIVGAGTVIGAGLGLLTGLVDKGVTSVNRKTTVDKRLMETVVENLKKSGLQEGQKFTRDPKTANELKTKVCIVVARTNGDLKVLVNTVADKKLETVTNNLLKNIPNSSAITKNMSDKFNDITITSVSDSSADAGLITGIAEHFIHSGYPVYLVEVG